MEAQKVLFNVRNGHIAKLTKTITNGVETITYGTPFKIDGLVGISFEPEGDITNFYADGIKYFTASKNNGYSGDMEVAKTPEEFLTQIFGRVKDSAGLVFENVDDEVANFALLFEAEGDSANRRFCFYNCYAKRPSRENNTTEESIEVDTETMEISMDPRSTDGMVMCYCDSSNATAYNAFFTAVPEKTA